MDSWNHIFAEGEAEPEGSGAEEIAKQALCSFFPLKKEHASALRRSWDEGNCHRWGRCRWTDTTVSAPCIGPLGSSCRRQLLLVRLLMFGFSSPGSVPCTPVGFDLNDSLGDELAAVAFVRSELPVSTDLPFEKVEDSRTCSEGFVIRVARAREELFVTLVTEVSLISRDPNLRSERISISRRFL